MRQILPALLARQATAAAVAIVLFGLAAALGFIALGWAAYAIHQHFVPVHGPAIAAWISGAIFLAAAAIVAALAWHRLKRVVAVAPRPQTEPQHSSSQAAPDLALLVAGVVQEQLPKHAVPAALLALIGGIVVGLNPGAAQTVVDALNRKKPS